MNSSQYSLVTARDIPIKGMSTDGDQDKRNGNGTDSVLDQKVSPCETSTSSPTSTSLNAISGASPDEGSGLKNDSSCRRKLFKSCPLEDQDKPIDLSLKKLNKETAIVCKVEKDNEDIIYVHNTSDSPKCSQDSITDSLPSSSSHHPPPSQQDLRVATISKYNTALQNPMALSYLPWALSQRPGTVPYAGALLTPFWHPSLIMSQGATQTSGLSSYSYSVPIPPTIGATFPTSSALHQQWYSQKLLAEFSRMYAQTGNPYGSKLIGGGPMSNIRGKKDSLSAGIQAIALRDDVKEEEGGKSDARCHVKKEAFSQQHFALPAHPRKRKVDELSSGQCLAYTDV